MARFFEIIVCTVNAAKLANVILYFSQRQELFIFHCSFFGTKVLDMRTERRQKIKRDYSGGSLYSLVASLRNKPQGPSKINHETAVLRYHYLSFLLYFATLRVFYKSYILNENNVGCEAFIYRQCKL